MQWGWGSQISYGGNITKVYCSSSLLALRGGVCVYTFPGGKAFQHLNGTLCVFAYQICVAELSLFVDSPPPPYSKRAIKERVFIEQGMNSLTNYCHSMPLVSLYAFVSCIFILLVTIFCKLVLAHFHFLVYISTYANNKLTL